MSLALALCLLATTADRLPPAHLNLRLAAPISSWDEAIPLGNGLLGGLLWGQDGTLRLSLDRGDLWDERPARNVPWERFNYATMVQLAREKKIGELNTIFDNPYNDVYPTKIPAGRLELELAPGAQLKSFELNLATAEGYAHLGDGRRVRAFFDANQPLALIEVPGEAAKLTLRAPESVKRLGYADPERGQQDELEWFIQPTVGDLCYCVLVGRRKVGATTLLAATVTSSTESADPRAQAAGRVRAALDRGYERLAAGHRRWWSGFWQQSRVTVPQDDILQHYYLVQYFHGAASRLGAPPMPLQGVWTADAGGLPPWKGDYHNDLNTQMTYIAYQAAGHFDEGRCFLDFNWNLLPRYRRFAKEFYGVDGAAVPGVMTLHGEPLGGWGQYSLSPTMGAWIGHLFYLHWRYTADSTFLRDRALPWCREVATALLALMKVDPADGRLKLPLSSSPEIHDNSLRAFLTPMTNYDLACSKMLFLGTAEMAAAAGNAADAAKWRDAATRLGDFYARADGVLRLNAEEDLPGSHRHLSNLIGIHPFGLLTVDTPAEKTIIDASTKAWDKLGTGAWCGYSFSWMSCLRARAGEAEAALRYLDIYTKAFILRNGFHANGDQTKSGFSGFQYRPFTLEGNFLAAQAVHEMLLGSWSTTPGGPGTLRIFPSMPWRWHDASFDDLRAEGGHRVSARRVNNATVWLRIVAGSNGPLRLRDNFGDRQPRFTRPARRDGDDLVFNMRKGDSLEATFAKPTAPPPAPADAAEPVVIAKPAMLTANTLPLRLGADSQGNNRFQGLLTGIRVYPRALADAEVALLAANQAVPCAVVAMDFADLLNAGSAKLTPKLVGRGDLVAEGPLGHALALTGDGYVELPHDKLLDCLDGVTLAAWIKPAVASGARVIDKSPVGEASAYLLDMYPGNALRLIHRDPHVTADVKLPLGQWSHVAAVVDVAAGEGRLYVGGKRVR